MWWVAAHRGGMLRDEERTEEAVELGEWLNSPLSI